MLAEAAQKLDIDTSWLPPAVLPDDMNLILLEPNGESPSCGETPHPIGRGSQRICFLARRRDSPARVVVKWYWPPNSGVQSKAVMESVYREIGLTAIDSHENIIRSYELIEPSRRGNKILPPGIVMEQFQCTLRELLDQNGTRGLDANAAFGIVHGVAKGLRFLHQLRYVHRDLVPENVAILGSDSGEIHAAVADLSTLAIDSQPPGLIVCPADIRYVAPERNSGPPRLRWDVFSLGAIVRTVLQACSSEIPILNLVAQLCQNAPARRSCIDHICQLLGANIDSPLCSPIFDAKRQSDCYMTDETYGALSLQAPTVSNSRPNDIRLIADNVSRGLHEDVCAHTNRLLNRNKIDAATEGEVHSFRAFAQFHLGQFTEAAEHIQKAVNLLGDSPARNANLALCLHSAGRPSSARSLALSSVERWPEHPRMLSVAGHILAEQNDVSDGLQLLSRAAELESQIAGPLCIQARVFARLGKLNKAIEKIEAALRREPRNPVCLNQHGVLMVRRASIGKGRLSMESMQTAIDSFRRAVCISDQNRDYTLNLAIAQLMCGEAVDAIATLSQSWVDHSQDSRMLGCLGECYSMIGSWNLAIKALRGSLKLRPDDATLLNNLGVALLWTGQIKEALRAFSRVGDEEDCVASARVNMAICILELGNPESAIDVLEQAQSLGVDDWQLH